MLLNFRIEYLKKKLCKQILKYGLQDEKAKNTSIKLDKLINKYNDKNKGIDN